MNQKAEGNLNKALIIIAFVVIIIVAGSSIYGKQQEIGTLNEEIENIDNELEIVSNSIENNMKQNKLCIKYLTKGFNEHGTAALNLGIADAYYDAASELYELDSFAWGVWYADYADTYYGYASSTYRDAKAFLLKH